MWSRIWIYKETLGNNLTELNHSADEVTEPHTGEVICSKLSGELRQNGHQILYHLFQLSRCPLFYTISTRGKLFSNSMQKHLCKIFYIQQKRKELKQNSVMKDHYYRIQIYYHVDKKKIGLLKST